MRRGHLLLLVVACAGSEARAEDRFVAPLPPDAEVQLRRDVEYVSDAAGRALFDLYRPARASAPVPVVVFVNGIGAPWLRGHVQYTSWPRAVTARGLAGIAMDAREASVDEDVARLVSVPWRARRPSWAWTPTASRSGRAPANVRRGLPLALRLAPACAPRWRTTARRRSRASRPIVRCCWSARASTAPISTAASTRWRRSACARMRRSPVLNVAAGVHGFDLRDDDASARAAIRATLDFLEATLSGGVSEAVRAGASRSAAAAAVAQGDWAAAARLWQQVVGERPADANAWQRLGEARRQLGDGPGALQAFDKALALGTPNRGQIGFAVAGIHAEAGDVEGAITALRTMGPLLRFFREPLETSPAFAAVRRDPRYAAILAAVPPAPR